MRIQYTLHNNAKVYNIVSDVSASSQTAFQNLFLITDVG